RTASACSTARTPGRAERAVLALPTARHLSKTRQMRRQGSLLASPTVTQSDPEISVIIPCLNEEAAVGKVVDQSLVGIRRAGRSGEVVVVDNGSTDGSAAIASAHGARVVRERRRGYGSAYLTGLSAARGQYLVMGDADDTYPMNELGSFVERLERGDDLV